MTYIWVHPGGVIPYIRSHIFKRVCSVCVRMRGGDIMTILFTNEIYLALVDDKKGRSYQ